MLIIFILMMPAGSSTSIAAFMFDSPVMLPLCHRYAIYRFHFTYAAIYSRQRRRLFYLRYYAIPTRRASHLFYREYFVYARCHAAHAHFRAATFLPSLMITILITPPFSLLVYFRHGCLFLSMLSFIAMTPYFAYFRRCHARFLMPYAATHCHAFFAPAMLYAAFSLRADCDGFSPCALLL